MCADFNYYLNRAGIRGLQGIKGDQGDSPIITVQSETPNEYILKITNPDGTELLSPNLRGNKININEGTYVRYNTETGELYTSTADGATGELAGVVRLATDTDITDMDEKSAVTPSQLADALSKYLTSPDGSVKIIQNADTSLTELTAEGGLTDLPIASADTLGGVKIGENLSITADGVLSSTAGGGDVSAAGDNRFTGANTFTGDVNIAGAPLTVEGVANLNQVTAKYINATSITSPGEINAVSIKSTGIRSDDIQTTENKKYLTENDVDNQTIQVVDGKLHANLDELGNEVNTLSGNVNNLSGEVTSLSGELTDLSGRVTATEADITTIQTNITNINSVLEKKASTTDLENGLKTKQDKKLFDKSKFTVIGSPTITDDGVASGFSAGNYLKFPSFNNSNFSIILPITLSKILDNTRLFEEIATTEYISRIVILNSRIHLFVASNDGTTWSVNKNGKTALSPNTKYYVRFSYDGTIYRVDISNDLINWQNEIEAGSSTLLRNVEWKAISTIETIDLKSISIIVDGKEVFSGSKDIYQALDEKQNKLTAGGNITLTDNEDGTTTIAAESTIPTNMVTTDTEQTITGKKSLPLSTTLGRLSFKAEGFDDNVGKLIWTLDNGQSAALQISRYNYFGFLLNDSENWSIRNDDTNNIQTWGSSQRDILIKTSRGNGLKIVGKNDGRDLELTNETGDFSFLRSKDIDGSTIKIVDGKLTASVSADLPVATTETLGGIKVGKNLTITESGVLSATIPTPIIELVDGGNASGA